MRSDADLRGLHEINDEFHAALFSACGNPYLVRTLQDYMGLTLPMRARNLADPDGLAKSRREHDMMIELLSGNDSWALAQLCVAHLQASKADYLQRVEAGTARLLVSLARDGAVHRRVEDVPVEAQPRSRNASASRRRL